MKCLKFIVVLFAIHFIGSVKCQYVRLFNSTTLAGSSPHSELLIVDTIMYGINASGGKYNKGVLFSISTNGNAYTKLVEFDGIGKGANLHVNVILVDSFLYGVTINGGVNDAGVMFKVKTNGTSFVKMFDFGGTDTGSCPKASLCLVGDTLYGKTQGGGTAGQGIIFKIKKDGTGFKKIFDFTGLNGSIAIEALTYYQGYLYGSTFFGGENNAGVLFRINKDGGEYLKLIDFDGTIYGGYPIGKPLIWHGKLYGVTNSGGEFGYGTIYTVGLDGSNPKKLFDFSNGKPANSITEFKDILYTMTVYGEKNSCGQIIRIDTSWNKVNSLFEFGQLDGCRPLGSLTIIDSVFYGVTSEGGSDSKGLIFKYRLKKYPYYQSSGIKLSNITDTSVNITWTNGSGDKRAVFIMTNSGTGVFSPVDSVAYIANKVFSKGDQIGNSGWYCVYNDTGNSVRVSGLHPGTPYLVFIYEYYFSAGSEEYNLNLSANNPVGFSTTGNPGVLRTEQIKNIIHPNPSSGIIFIEEDALKIDLIDIKGVFCGVFFDKQIDISYMPDGIYFLNIYNKDGFVKREKIILVK